MYTLLLAGCPAEPLPPVEEDTYEPAPYIYDEEEPQDRILVRASVDPPDMPPQGGTTADDRTLLLYWMNCAEEGT